MGSNMSTGGWIGIGIGAAVIIGGVIGGSIALVRHQSDEIKSAREAKKDAKEKAKQEYKETMSQINEEYDSKVHDINEARNAKDEEAKDEEAKETKTKKKAAR
jgi:hypothetical protein